MTDLNLIHMRRPNLRIPLHLLDMLHPEVTNTNTLRLTLFQQPLQCLPQLLPTRRPRPGTVNQEQIHISILTPNLLNTPQHLLIRSIRRTSGAQDFSGREDLTPRNPGFLNRLADFCFVCVELRRVDVSVSVLQGCLGGLDTLSGWGAIDAETETGDLDWGVREGEEVCDCVVGHFLLCLGLVYSILARNSCEL